jgi:ABC-type oligopeptide transport system substrate-binding subunit
MKKFASLLLAFAMTVGMLTGCGGDSGTSSTGEAPAQEVTVAISSTFATLNPAGFQHMGDMGRIFESELIDQDEEGGERGDEYDSFGHHVQQALHIRPVHSE